ncbi:MAG: DUF6504 family protein [Planctomycetota bacterium]|jgi:hypothetical protein
MSEASGQNLVSEPIEPEAGSFSPVPMATGLASLPAAFTWRNRRYEIIECLDQAKVSAPEGGVEGHERYLRRQVFSVRLHTGQAATLYLERQARRGASPRAARQRWFLYSIDPEPPD